MTFDEYNTDEYFDNAKSSAKGLVDAYKKDNPNGTAEDFYSKLSTKWKEDKKGNVKNAVEEAFKSTEEPKKEPSADDAVGIKALKSINAVPEAPKSNPPEKPAEEKTAPKVEEMTQTTEALEQPKAEPEEEKTPYTSPLESEETGIKQSDKSYLNETNAILNEEQKEELKKLSKTSLDAYNRTMSNMERSGDAFKKIDDRLIEQLPTFMFKRYQQGEFGDPKSNDAKLRLAYFAINNVVSKFKQIANADAISRGKGAIFENTESAYDKYQKTNLEQGLENRWSKYKQETQAAVDMVKNRNVSEEEALNIVNKISMNNRLQNAFNMADENKKAYMIEVLSKVGDKVSNWNDQKFINALIGAEITGENVDNAVALIGARAGGKALDQLGLFDENGNLDISVLKQYINLPGFTDKFKAQFGFDPTQLIPKEGEGGSNGDPNKKPDLPGSETLSKVPFKKTYEGDTSREGSFWGGKLDDKTMKMYTTLQTKKPSGIETELVTDEELKAFLDANPDMKGGDVLKKAGIKDRMVKQGKELQRAVDQAEKQYKKDNDFDAYKKRVNELNDYFTDLEKMSNKFGYANLLLNYENIHKVAKKVNKKK